MNSKSQVILSGFADEAANEKKVEQQFAALAALGLQFFSIRFIDAGEGVKNVMKLTKSEVARINELRQEYGLSISSIGSPIGKVKLLDKDDGTTNQYIPFKKYLSHDVKRACEQAHAFGAKLIRGFSFYHPKGTPPEDHLAMVVDHLGQIAAECDSAGLTFGLEVEANLVGQTGEMLAEIHRKVNHPALLLIFDAANIVCQGYTPGETFGQYVAMKPGLGWLHIKDYRIPTHIQRQGHVDEDALKNFVPADQGDGGHELILRDFREYIPTVERRLRKRGIPGVFVDLEPHLKGGGQFGGFSGPDGFGVALRALCRVLDYVGIGYHLRDFDDIREARGF
jgi:sugar phosphate isomerase/epimerase